MFNPDPACLVETTSSADWLEKNFGIFSVYASLEDLQTLNENFSSVSTLGLAPAAHANCHYFLNVFIILSKRPHLRYIICCPCYASVWIVGAAEP